MISLVGYTGFVGGNLAASGKIDGLYNTKNIEEAYDTKPDLLIYAGLRAEKFLAEKDPRADLASVYQAKEIIQKIEPKNMVLISTVDVFETPLHATENTPADGAGAYGKNRALFERWVQNRFPDSLTVRLPGLFGKGIKKNFIYDYIHYIPALLTEAKFLELSEQEPVLKDWYRLNEKGFYALKDAGKEETAMLRSRFEALGFSALCFTDSRGVFQYYNLAHLFNDISAALAHNIKTLNLATEPVSIREIYAHLTGEPFENHLGKEPPFYDFRTLHYRELEGFPAEDGTGGYLYSKAEILNDIKMFTEKECLA